VVQFLAAGVFQGPASLDGEAGSAQGFGVFPVSGAAGALPSVELSEPGSLLARHPPTVGPICLGEKVSGGQGDRTIVSTVKPLLQNRNRIYRSENLFAIL
jgi:hypothetical protein